VLSRSSGPFVGRCAPRARDIYGGVFGSAPLSDVWSRTAFVLTTTTIMLRGAHNLMMLSLQPASFSDPCPLTNPWHYLRRSRLTRHGLGAACVRVYIIMLCAAVEIIPFVKTLVRLIICLLLMPMLVYLNQSIDFCQYSIFYGSN
jgi:hypothetical protein